MRVAVVDVGSNTARLLVADVDIDGRVHTIDEVRQHLGLGAEIARTGELSVATVARVAEACRMYAKRARRLGAERAETLVTAPGRQGREPRMLVAALAAATRMPVRVLSSDEEGRLAYEGAVAQAQDELPEVVAAVDVGGGSTEIVVGTPLLGAAWIRSIDLGSLRLTGPMLTEDPPRPGAVEAARQAVRAAFAATYPPAPDLALATGGSARAVAKVVGRSFGPHELDEVVERFSRRPAAKVGRALGIDAPRARTVVAGALLLAATSRALGVPLELANGGLREGAALDLATRPVTSLAA